MTDQQANQTKMIIPLTEAERDQTLTPIHKLITELKVEVVEDYLAPGWAMGG